MPIYTYDADLAATRFDLFIQSNSIPGGQDLAAGAGGSYRYLRGVADIDNPVKITGLALDRSKSAVTAFPANYAGHTSDINANRKKDYLYLLWASRTAY